MFIHTPSFTKYFDHQGTEIMAHTYLRNKFHKNASALSFADRGIDRDEMGYPNNLGVGTRIFGRIEAAATSHTKPGEIRPLFVTGLWKRDGFLEKIEVLQFTTKMQRVSPGDVLITEPGIMAAFDSNKPGRLRTHSTLILNNTKDNFPDGRKVGDVFKIDPNLWFDLLVRRAYSLMYDSLVEVLSEGGIDLSLRRSGITFRAIPDAAICADIPFIPDHGGSVLPRRNIKGVPQENIDEIPKQVVAYVNKFGLAGALNFPSLQDWPEDLAFTDYPVWQQIPTKRSFHLP